MLIQGGGYGCTGGARGFRGGGYRGLGGTGGQGF